MLDFIQEEAKKTLNVGGYKLSDKSACIAFNKNPSSEATVAKLVQSLYDDLMKKWPNKPRSASKMNWVWRDEFRPANKKGKEVWIERRVCELGGLREWNFQMPVVSGIKDSRGGRRAIDLVRKLKSGNGAYQFIELKLESDNPLYAAFEILGYGLAYLVARSKGGPHEVEEVMQASRIELLVLAPETFFTYSEKRGGAKIGYRLKTLETGINRGLKGIVPKPLEMSFSFACFDAHDKNKEAAAKAIAHGQYKRLHQGS